MRPPNLNFEGVFGALQSPGIAQAEPLVGGFHLPAVANLLVEDAVLVADAVADGGNVEGGKGIHEAGGQTAEAAVAEAGLGLLLDQRFEIEAELAHGFIGFVVDAEVDEVVGQVRAGEEFGREVADDADVLRAVVEDGLNPALDEAVADGVGESHVEIVVRWRGRASVPAQRKGCRGTNGPGRRRRRLFFGFSAILPGRDRAVQEQPWNTSNAGHVPGHIAEN